MAEKQNGFKDAAEILKGLMLCVLLLPVGIIFLVLGTITGLTELFLKKVDQCAVRGK